MMTNELRAQNSPIVVVVDDDLDTTKQLIKLSFVENEVSRDFEGIRFLWCTNHETFAAILEERSVDLVISDLKLIDDDGGENKQLGYDVIAHARKKTDAAIIVFSSQPSEADEATTLIEGADDYVEKNNSPHRIALRIIYWLGRVSQEAQAKTKKFLIGTWLFSPGELYLKSALSKGCGPKLSYAEHDLLKYLCSNPTYSITRDEYNAWVLKGDESVSVRRLDNQIRRLRSKLKNAGLVQSIRGGGYRLSDVQEVRS